MSENKKYNSTAFRSCCDDAESVILSYKQKKSTECDFLSDANLSEDSTIGGCVYINSVTWFGTMSE